MRNDSKSLSKFGLLVSMVSILIGVSAQAEVLLDCNLSESDIVGAQISRSDDGLTLSEVSKNGGVSVSAVSQSDWEFQNFRLSDSRLGFRYLRYTYSSYFGEWGWFVEAGGGSNYSISRAECR